MNDFTKEELNIIKRALYFYLGTNAGGRIHEVLNLKIKSYCQHIPILKLNTEGVDIFICKKCNKAV